MPYQYADSTPSGDNGRRLAARLFRCLVKRAAVVVTCLALCASLLTVPSQMAFAAGDTRSLKLYFVHTGERAEITFKRNGRYDARGLQEINRFLRDWRRNEPTRMDPRLFDLVWEVYRRVGASDFIHVVSAYRSPATNGALRSRTKGVAKNSQHMLGKAMDFFIPGVKLTTLRATAMQLQVGGVGYYPTSGSPFVHLDVGSVRAWPRMSRQELVKLFPNGNTMHLPADGTPLPGYEQAVADYKRRVGASSIQVASTAGSASSSSSTRKPSNLFAMLFGNSGDEDEDAEAIAAPSQVPERPSAPVRPAAREPEAEEPVMVAAAVPVRPQTVAIPEVAAPVPLSRPAFRNEAPAPGLTALYSQPQTAAQEAIQAAMPATPATPVARPAPENSGFVDLANLSIPVPTLLGPRGLKGDSEAPVAMQTASLAPPAAEAELLANIPVPGHRPDIAAARVVETAAPVIATPPAAPAAPLAAPVLVATAKSEAEKQALTPELLAELARSAGYAPTPAPKPADKPKQVQQVALASPAVTKPEGMVFNDGFDMPKSAPAHAAQPTKVVKGGAVSKLGGRPANPGANVLTGDTLAQWALANKHTDTAASTKAPRMVVRALSTDMSAGYSGGFRPVSATVAIDPNRFSGANVPKP